MCIYLNLCQCAQPWVCLCVQERGPLIVCFLSCCYLWLLKWSQTPHICLDSSNWISVQWRKKRRRGVWSDKAGGRDLMRQRGRSMRKVGSGQANKDKVWGMVRSSKVRREITETDKTRSCRISVSSHNNFLHSCKSSQSSTITHLHQIWKTALARRSSYAETWYSKIP